jgi:hypothetical protein
MAKLFNEDFLINPPLSEEKLVYIRCIPAEELMRLFPQILLKETIEGDLFALLSSEGEPIFLSSSKEALIANAHAHDFEMVSLH